MAHNVILEETFSGPMDLMLHLVKRDEIDIHDIPIAHLTREYLAEMDKLRDQLDIDSASEFMAMASILMEIKSRMLLPTIEEQEGESEEDDFDPREGLVKALLEYKRFKEAATALGNLADEHAMRFVRIAPKMEIYEEEEEAEIDGVSSLDLLVAFQNMIRNMLTNEAQEIVNDEVATEVRLEQIMTAIESMEYTTFSKLLSDNPTKGEMVGFFIAMLELIRLKKVRARQAADFTDIHLERYVDTGYSEYDTPVYPEIRPKIPEGIGRRPVRLFGPTTFSRKVQAASARKIPLFPERDRLVWKLTESCAQSPFLPLPLAKRKVKIRREIIGSIADRKCTATTGQEQREITCNAAPSSTHAPTVKKSAGAVKGKYAVRLFGTATLRRKEAKAEKGAILLFPGSGKKSSVAGKARTVPHLLKVPGTGSKPAKQKFIYSADSTCQGYAPCIESPDASPAVIAATAKTKQIIFTKKTITLFGATAKTVQSKDSATPRKSPALFPAAIAKAGCGKTSAPRLPKRPRPFLGI
ncbi:MAG: segregation/condensation protein A [Planctomycetes bacterium]|nr:segregation/condensation protein A [Planctomycetota bacterium]